ncbi:MAG TPA: 5-(carboxyamino)imidazole ribonucleotide synthase, partial [Coriobacteriia bacterium]|nr:5-(carboxyamino)imidazole ribonucleotide synthase [Coriobacteriia bacterium]
THPSAAALRVAQDRLREKETFQELGIPVPDYAAVNDLETLRRAADAIGLPALLKTRTLGYDGKGQAVIEEARGIEPAWDAVGRAPAILESLVAFEREVSVIGARDKSGRCVFYPLAENRHRGGILRLSRTSAGDDQQSRAETFARRLLERLEYVGVLTLELFEARGQLLANEMAPRVHNSGHWTIEGAQPSQFENHLRAVCGLPVAQPTLVSPAAMVNFVGHLPPEDEIAVVSGATLHEYGKEARPGRKVGHVTLLRGDRSSSEHRSRLVRIVQLAGEHEIAEEVLGESP